MKLKKYVVAVTGCVMVLGSSFTAFAAERPDTAMEAGAMVYDAGTEGVCEGVAAEDSVTADDTKNVIYEELAEQAVMPYGAKPPTGTSCIDIVNNNYNFSAKMTVRLYTNSFFKGSSKVKVKVGSVSVDKNGMQNQSKGITVYLRKKGASIDVKYSVPLSGTSFYFTNLDPSAMYYLEFGKQNDTQIYTFTGTISNGK